MQSSEIDKVRALYQADQNALFAYALARTGNETLASDILHAVFCRLLERPRLPADLRPYVFRALRNAAIDHHRAGAVRDRASAMLQRLNGSTEPSRIAEQEEAALWLALLNEDEHETIVLKVFSGLSFREIAELREVSANTVASWYRRGLERIRAHIESETP